MVGSAVATGTTAITISASGTGVTTQTATVQLTVTAAAIPAFTLVAAPAALSVVAGQSGTSTVTITRTGGFVGAVTLTVEGAPVGVTATAAAPGTGTTSIVTLATAANTAAGTYNLTVRGTATGLTDRTSTIALTVTTAPGFILAASAASAQAGSSGASTVTITRVGGLTANVDLVASGLPANVSASFDPASASGTSSTLTFAAAGNATPGSYTVTVSGTATGASAQSTTVALTITAAPGGGNIVAWKFCDATRVPLWFAYRTGTTGTWTRVTGSADNTFSFTLSGTVGGVAFVQNQSGGGTQGTVYYYTAAELNNIALGECINSAGGNKSLNAIFTGLNGAQFQSGTVYVGGGSGTTGFTTTTATVSNVPNRVADLIAYRSTVNITTASLSVDRAVLRRNVNYAANSGIPSIDFDGAESFAIGVAALSFTNAGADLTSVSGSFSTSNGFVGAIAALAGNQVYGVPSSRTQAGDFHLINAIAVSTDNTSFRITSQYNRDIANRAITFGAALANATLSVTGTSPYARIKAVGAFTSEYNDVVSCSMSQGSAASSRAWSFNGSRAYFGTGNTAFEFELPDFSGVSGFLNTWGFTAGAQAQVTTNVLGGITGTLGTPAEGSAWRSGARLQTITP